MKYLTVKAGHELKALEALLDGKLTAVKDAHGDVTFTEEARDAGGQVMTVTDVAALLQLPVSAIREMCKSRSQRGPHPLPFIRVSGKAIRFKRDAIMRWLETTPQRPRRKR